MSNRTISLSEQEIVLLEEIIIDNDKDGALKFLIESVYKKVRAKEHGNLKPPV